MQYKSANKASDCTSAIIVSRYLRALSKSFTVSRKSAKSSISFHAFRETLTL